MQPPMIFVQGTTDKKPIDHSKKIQKKDFTLESVAVLHPDVSKINPKIINTLNTWVSTKMIAT